MASATANNASARIGLLKPDGVTSDFVFDFVVNRDGISRLAPNSNRRVYAANYAPVPLAQSDHTPKEWKSNNPTEINVSFEIVGSGQREIDSELRKLRKFMRKTKTGQPPDLLYVVGKKQWSIRIERLEVTPVLWTEGADEQRVKVQLFMHTISPED